MEVCQALELVREKLEGALGLLVLVHQLVHLHSDLPNEIPQLRFVSQG